VDPITRDYGTTAVGPANPTKEGYVFDGWYKEEEFTNEWTFATDVVTEDITLYTKWKALPVAGFVKALSFPADSLSMVTVPFNKDTNIGGNSNFTISMWIFPEDINPYKTLYRQHYTTSGSLGVWLRYIAPESR
jgi:uncharacterized repeat protein (TIGR02543 family)